MRGDVACRLSPGSPYAVQRELRGSRNRRGGVLKPGLGLDLRLGLGVNEEEDREAATGRGGMHG